MSSNIPSRSALHRRTNQTHQREFKYKQYLPKKPNKWGISVWARCGISGVVYDFEVYTGKNNTKKDNEIEGILMGENVVYCLTRTLPLNRVYKVFFDNFFSSIALLRKKKGY